jgi:GTP cyclohydrolase IA
MARPKNLEVQLEQFLLETFGDKVWDDSASNTVKRWMKAMREFKTDSVPDFEPTTFANTVNQLILVKDIQFASLCAHHLFPFSGTADVGYIPNKLMIGVSKIPRIVHHFARRPSTQETFTRAVASYLKDTVEAHGVAVVVKSVHSCMSCRGVKERSASMVTSEMRGVFLTSSEARQEFLQLTR